MKKARQRITKKLVDALQPGETIWDTDIRGFGVRRQIHDKVFILKASASGRRYYVTIGKHGSPFTVDQARNEAVRQLALLNSTTAFKSHKATCLHDEGFLRSIYSRSRPEI